MKDIHCPADCEYLDHPEHYQKLYGRCKKYKVELDWYDYWLRCEKCWELSRPKDATKGRGGKPNE